MCAAVPPSTLRPQHPQLKQYAPLCTKHPPWPHALTQWASSITMRASSPRRCSALQQVQQEERREGGAKDGVSASYRQQQLAPATATDASAAATDPPAPHTSSPQRLLQPLPLDQLLGSDIQQLDGGPLLAQLQKHGLQGGRQAKAGRQGRQAMKVAAIRERQVGSSSRAMRCRGCQQHTGRVASTSNSKCHPPPLAPAPTHPPTHPPTRDSVTVC